MEAIAMNDFEFPVSAPTAVAGPMHTGRRRITPKAGRGLEILSHAIEYLTDEFACDASSLSSKSTQLTAVQLLMALNREIYFECPEVPSFGERCRSILQHLAA
jgi:hypothetical protein